MTPKWHGEIDRVKRRLRTHSQTVRELPGIESLSALEALATQVVASIRREEYYRVLRFRRMVPERANPHHPSFDGERAIAYCCQQGNLEEGCWLAFLVTHLGRPSTSRWDMLRDLYGGLGETTWNWQAVSSDPSALIGWWRTRWQDIGGRFGNHRKYESLRPDANRSLAGVIESYLSWVGPKGHLSRISEAVVRSGNDPKLVFDDLYRGLNIRSFGRLAKLDYLAMLGRFALAPVEAPSAYLTGATGPLRGARLLFGESIGSRMAPSELQPLLDALDEHLGVGMVVMEDALCNWQKSPHRFVPFTG